MKMKNSEPFVLKVVDKCVKPFLSKDLNYSQIREMLRLKLIMDSRRVSSALQNNGKKIGKEPKKSMILTCLVYMGLGIFIAFMQIMPNMFLGSFQARRRRLRIRQWRICCVIVAIECCERGFDGFQQIREITMDWHSVQSMALFGERFE